MLIAGEPTEKVVAYTGLTPPQWTACALPTVERKNWQSSDFMAVAEQ